MERKDGTIIKTVIDTEDLQRLKDLELYWHSHWNPSTESYYAKASERYTAEDGTRKGRTLSLTRIILNITDPHILIDHINHDTLDNRKSNLRPLSDRDNSRYRESKNKNNKSGYRNVFWNKNANKWQVHIMINGKNELLGEFDDVHKAGQFAEEMRQKYYGEFAGAS